MEQDGQPTNKPVHYGQVICEKGGKNIQWRKDKLFSRWCWENWTAPCKRMKQIQSLTSYESERVSCSVILNSLRSHGLYLARFLYPWNSPGKNTGVGCHSHLQGIFLTQGYNPGLLHCRHILYQLSQIYCFPMCKKGSYTSSGASLVAQQ